MHKKPEFRFKQLRIRNWFLESENHTDYRTEYFFNSFYLFQSVTTIMHTASIPILGWYALYLNKILEFLYSRRNLLKDPKTSRIK